MCEACGPMNPRARTPGEEAIHKELMDMLRKRTETHIQRKGKRIEVILDPDCHGTGRMKFGAWFANQVFNVRVALGRV